MATDQTDELLEKIADLINQACDEGDNVSAIADRANVSRATISRLKNRSFNSYPSFDTLSHISNALGYSVRVELKKS